MGVCVCVCVCVCVGGRDAVFMCTCERVALHSMYAVCVCACVWCVRVCALEKFSLEKQLACNLPLQGVTVSHHHTQCHIIIHSVTSSYTVSHHHTQCHIIIFAVARFVCVCVCVCI